MSHNIRVADPWNASTHKLHYVAVLVMRNEAVVRPSGSITMTMKQ